MIHSSLTEYFAQRSYDHLRETGGKGMSQREMFGHALVQGVNMGIHVAPIAALTSMSNPHIMSYGYKGISAATYGIGAAQADRLAFQRASSKSFRIGAKLGGKIGGKLALRAIPGLGWAMLAHDVYDLAANRRLFGIKL